MHWLPYSSSSGRVRCTSHVKVTLVATAVASASVAVEVNEVLVVAVKGSRESTGLARNGEDRERADRSCKMLDYSNLRSPGASPRSKFLFDFVLRSFREI